MRNSGISHDIFLALSAVKRNVRPTTRNVLNTDIALTQNSVRGDKITTSETTYNRELPNRLANEKQND